VVQNPLFKAAREFENQYLECLSVEKVANKFNKEWRDRLVKEMLRFNGKTPSTGFDGSESVSDNTSEGMKSQKAMQQRPKSALKGASGAPPQQNTPGGGQVKFNQKDDVDDAIAMLNPNAASRQRKDSGDSINFRETGGFEGGSSHRRNDSGSLIQPIAVNNSDFMDRGLDGPSGSHRAEAAFLDAEEKENEEQRRREEEKKKASESPYKEFYRDPATGNHYDPAKKFGIIQDNSLLYDNVTTSYPLNLPTDYYQKYIQGTLPQKGDSQIKWFIRPHHLETLTNHPQSVKDDVLNTRYYSHYN